MRFVFEGSVSVGSCLGFSDMLSSIFSCVFRTLLLSFISIFSKCKRSQISSFYSKIFHFLYLADSVLFRHAKCFLILSYQVLVDAECTHDGSIRHVQKFENWGWQTLERRVLDAERTDDLTNLQVIISKNCLQFWYFLNVLL